MPMSVLRGVESGRLNSVIDFALMSFVVVFVIAFVLLYIMRCARRERWREHCSQSPLSIIWNESIDDYLMSGQMRAHADGSDNKTGLFQKLGNVVKSTTTAVVSMMGFRPSSAPTEPGLDQIGAGPPVSGRAAHLLTVAYCTTRATNIDEPRLMSSTTELFAALQAKNETVTVEEILSQVDLYCLEFCSRMLSSLAHACLGDQQLWSSALGRFGSLADLWLTWIQPSQHAIVELIELPHLSDAMLPIIIEMLQLLQTLSSQTLVFAVPPVQLAGDATNLKNRIFLEQCWLCWSFFSNLYHQRTELNLLCKPLCCSINTLQTGCNLHEILGQWHRFIHQYNGQLVFHITPTSMFVFRLYPDLTISELLLNADNFCLIQISTCVEPLPNHCELCDCLDTVDNNILASPSPLHIVNARARIDEANFLSAYSQSVSSWLLISIRVVCQDLIRSIPWWNTSDHPYAALIPRDNFYSNQPSPPRQADVDLTAALLITHFQTRENAVLEMIAMLPSGMQFFEAAVVLLFINSIAYDHDTKSVLRMSTEFFWNSCRVLGATKLYQTRLELFAVVDMIILSVANHIQLFTRGRTFSASEVCQELRQEICALDQLDQVRELIFRLDEFKETLPAAALVRDQIFQAYAECLARHIDGIELDKFGSFQIEFIAQAQLFPNCPELEHALNDFKTRASKWHTELRNSCVDKRLGLWGSEPLFSRSGNSPTMLAILWICGVAQSFCRELKRTVERLRADLQSFLDITLSSVERSVQGNIFELCRKELWRLDQEYPLIMQYLEKPADLSTVTQVQVDKIRLLVRQIAALVNHVAPIHQLCTSRGLQTTIIRRFLAHQQATTPKSQQKLVMNHLREFLEAMSDGKVSSEYLHMMQDDELVRMYDTCAEQLQETLPRQKFSQVTTLLSTFYKLGGYKIVTILYGLHVVNEQLHEVDVGVSSTVWSDSVVWDFALPSNDFADAARHWCELLLYGTKVTSRENFIALFNSQWWMDPRFNQFHLCDLVPMALVRTIVECISNVPSISDASLLMLMDIMSNAYLLAQLKEWCSNQNVSAEDFRQLFHTNASHSGAHRQTRVLGLVLTLFKPLKSSAFDPRKGMFSFMNIFKLLMQQELKISASSDEVQTVTLVDLHPISRALTQTTPSASTKSLASRVLHMLNDNQTRLSLSLLRNRQGQIVPEYELRFGEFTIDSDRADDIVAQVQGVAAAFSDATFEASLAPNGGNLLAVAYNVLGKLREIIEICTALVGCSAFGFTMPRLLLKSCQLTQANLDIMLEYFRRFQLAWTATAAHYHNSCPQLPGKPMRQLMRLSSSELSILHYHLYRTTAAESEKIYQFSTPKTSDDSFSRSSRRSSLARAVPPPSLSSLIGGQAPLSAYLVTNTAECFHEKDVTRLSVYIVQNLSDALSAQFNHLAEFLTAHPIPRSVKHLPTHFGKLAWITLNSVAFPANNAASVDSVTLLRSLLSLNQLFAVGDGSPLLPARDQLFVCNQSGSNSPGSSDIAQLQQLQRFVLYALSAPEGEMFVVAFPELLSSAQQSQFAEFLQSSLLLNSSSKSLLIFLTGDPPAESPRLHDELSRALSYGGRSRHSVNMSSPVQTHAAIQNVCKQRGLVVESVTNILVPQSGKSYAIDKRLRTPQGDKARESVLPVQLAFQSDLTSFLNQFDRENSNQVWIETVVYDTPDAQKDARLALQQHPLETMLFQLFVFGTVVSEGGQVWRLHAKQTTLHVELHIHPLASTQPTAVHLNQLLPLLAMALPAKVHLHSPKLDLDQLPHSFPDSSNRCDCQWHDKAFRYCPQLETFEWKANNSTSWNQLKRFSTFWHWFCHHRPPEGSVEIAHDPAALFGSSLALFLNSAKALRASKLFDWVVNHGTSGIDCHILYLPSLKLAQQKIWPPLFEWGHTSQLDPNLPLNQRMKESLQAIRLLLPDELAGEYDTLSRITPSLADVMDGMFGSDSVLKTMHEFSATFLFTPLVMLRLVILGVHFLLGLPLVLEGETGVGKTKLLQVFSYLANAACAAPDGKPVVQLHQLDMHPAQTALEIGLWIQSKLPQSDPRYSHAGIATSWVQAPTTILFVDEINATTPAILDVMRSAIMDRRAVFNNGTRGRICNEVWFVAACNPFERRPASENQVQVASRYTVWPLPPSLYELQWPLDALNQQDILFILSSQLVGFGAHIYNKGIWTPDCGKFLMAHLIRLHEHAQNYAVEQWNRGVSVPAVSLREISRVFQLALCLSETFSSIETPFHALPHEKAEMQNFAVRCILISAGLVYLSRCSTADLLPLTSSKTVTSVSLAFDLVTSTATRLCKELQVDKHDNIVLTSSVQQMLLLLLTHALARVPVFLIGEPGSSKSLTVAILTSLLRDVMLRDQSPLVERAPSFALTVLQCSSSLTESSLAGEFDRAANFLEITDSAQEAVLIVLEELGLACSADAAPSLKILHSLLDKQNDASLPRNKRVAFAALSNTYLDVAKMNRGTVLYVSPPTEDELVIELEKICLQIPGQQTPSSLLDAFRLLLAGSFGVHSTANIDTSSSPTKLGLRDVFSSLNRFRAVIPSFEANGILPCGCVLTPELFTWLEFRAALEAECFGLGKVARLFHSLFDTLLPTQHNFCGSFMSPVVLFVRAIKQAGESSGGALADSISIRDRPLFCITDLPPLGFWFHLLQLPPVSDDTNVVAPPSYLYHLNNPLDAVVKAMQQAGVHWLCGDDQLYSALLDVFNGHAFMKPSRTRTSDASDQRSLARVAQRGRSFYTPLHPNALFLLTHTASEIATWPNQKALMSRMRKFEFQSEDVFKLAVAQLVAVEDPGKLEVCLANLRRQLVDEKVQEWIASFNIELSTFKLAVLLEARDRTLQTDSSIQNATDRVELLLAEVNAVLTDYNCFSPIANTIWRGLLKLKPKTPVLYVAQMFHSPLLDSAHYVVAAEYINLLYDAPRGSLAPCFLFTVEDLNKLLDTDDNNDDANPSILVITSAMLRECLNNFWRLASLKRPMQLIIEVDVLSGQLPLVAEAMDSLWQFNIDEDDSEACSCLLILATPLDLEYSLAPEARLLSVPTWRFINLSPPMTDSKWPTLSSSSVLELHVLERLDRLRDLPCFSWLPSLLRVKFASTDNSTATLALDRTLVTPRLLRMVGFLVDENSKREQADFVLFDFNIHMKRSGPMRLASTGFHKPFHTKTPVNVIYSGPVSSQLSLLAMRWLRDQPAYADSAGLQLEPFQDPLRGEALPARATERLFVIAVTIPPQANPAQLAACIEQIASYYRSIDFPSDALQLLMEPSTFQKCAGNYQPHIQDLVSYLKMSMFTEATLDLNNNCVSLCSPTRTLSEDSVEFLDQMKHRLSFIYVVLDGWDLCHKWLGLSNLAPTNDFTRDLCTKMVYLLKKSFPDHPCIRLPPPQAPILCEDSQLGLEVRRMFQEDAIRTLEVEFGQFQCSAFVFPRNLHKSMTELVRKLNGIRHAEAWLLSPETVVTYTWRPEGVLDDSLSPSQLRTVGVLATLSATLEHPIDHEIANAEIVSRLMSLNTVNQTLSQITSNCVGRGLPEEDCEHNGSMPWKYQMTLLASQSTVSGICYPIPVAKDYKNILALWGTANQINFTVAHLENYVQEAVEFPECYTCSSRCSLQAILLICSNSAEAHHYCIECSINFAKTELEIHKVKQRNGDVSLTCPCGSAVLTSDESIEKIRREVMIELTEERIREEVTREWQERFKQEVDRLKNVSAREAELERQRKIIDEQLELTCPRCKQVFVDFTGCLALTCSRVTCQAGFCAICLADCGNDAHAHVVNCPARGNPRPVYGQAQEFENAHKIRRERAIAAFLAGIADSEIKKAMHTYISNLHVVIADKLAVPAV